MAEESSLIAVFETAEATDAAAQSLVDAGFPPKNISIVGRDRHADANLREYMADPDRLRELATAGVVGGGLFGFLVGVAAIWVPGIGALIAAGPLSAALLAGVEGAALGAVALGLIGSLVSLGVTQEQAHDYENMVKEGKYLLIAHGDAGAVRRAHDLLQAAHDPHIQEMDMYGEYV